jgi:hypothetical protein
MNVGIFFHKLFLLAMLQKKLRTRGRSEESRATALAACSGRLGRSTRGSGRSKMANDTFSLAPHHEDFLYLRSTPKAQGFFSEPRRFCVLTSSRLLVYERTQVQISFLFEPQFHFLLFTSQDAALMKNLKHEYTVLGANEWDARGLMYNYVSRIVSRKAAST